MNSHQQAEIITCLEKVTVGVLSTLDRQSIRSRVMYYVVDEKFNYYLMSTRGSPKIEQVLASAYVSLLVFGLEEPFDRSWEVEVNGRAEVLKEKEELARALEKLKGRNPFAEVAWEAGIFDQFDLLKLTPRVLRFRIYGEALKGEPPTVLEFK